MSSELCSRVALTRRWKLQAAPVPKLMACTCLLVVVAHMARAQEAAALASRVRVESMIPSGEISRTTNLTWVFSKDVVADSSLRKPVKPAPVVFSPEIPGTFRWVDRRKLRFYPDVKLAPSTLYTAKLSTDVLGPHGPALKGQTKFEFTTPRLRVNSAFLTFKYDARTRERAKLVATVEFNHAGAGTSKGTAEGRQLLHPGTAYLITEILSRLRRPELPAAWEAATNVPKVAWKTGTSYGHRDAWSIGYTPRHTIGVWIGNMDDKGVRALVGADVAAPLLFALFNRLESNPSDHWFVRPFDCSIWKGVTCAP